MQAKVIDNKKQQGEIIKLRFVTIYRKRNSVHYFIKKKN